ncbi:MAG: nickel-responsive transcriptional regulator NikR [Pseudomonadota bacterium]
MNESRTTRFGISADIRLLEQFDKMISEKGYANRSEAVRDIIRNQLVEHSWTKKNDNVVGTITLVYNHESKELTEKLTEIQHQNYLNVISSIHVHLDNHNCLETLILKGKSQTIKGISDKLIGAKGVKHGKLVMSTTGRKLF